MILSGLIVPGLSDQENVWLNECLSQLRARSGSNRLRRLYFESEQTTRHFGISVPPQFQTVSSVIGLPAKAVEALEHRINLDSLVTPNGGMEVMGLGEIWQDNHISIEATQAHTTALTYGVSFIAVFKGGPGQPPAVIRNLSPTSSTALWDPNRRRARVALTVTGSRAGLMTEFILFTDRFVITATETNGQWEVERSGHKLGRCPVAVLPYKPSLDKPFGRSRISKPVMAITDRMVRTLLRGEINSEFFSAPKATILGADDDIFRDDDGNLIPQWAAYLSRVEVIPTPDYEGAQTPTIHHAPQASMEPHIAMLRSDAALFSGETNIPVHMLGVIHDNPASDAAIHSSFIELNKDAERAQDPFGAGWADAFQMAVQVRDNLTEVPDEIRYLRGNFRDPATPTLGQAADAVMKLVSAGVLPADSDVVLEMLNLPATTIQRIKTDRRKAAGAALLDQIVAGATPTPTPVPDAPVTPSLPGETA